MGRFFRDSRCVYTGAGVIWLCGMTLGLAIGANFLIAFSIANVMVALWFVICSICVFS